MVLDVLGAVLGVSGSVVKLVDHGFKLYAAEEDMAAAGELLSLISETAESVRYSRDQLFPHLTSRQKQHIQTVLYRTDRLLHTSRKALNKRFTATGEGAMLGLSDRLLWVFKDKGTIMTYQTVLECLQGILLATRIELEMLNFRIDTISELRSQNFLDIVCYGRSSSTFVSGLATYTPTSSVEDEELCSQESEVKVDEDLKRADRERVMSSQHVRTKLGDVTPEASEIEVEFSITTSLKRMYTLRAMRENASQLESVPKSKFIEVEFSITTALRRRYTERTMKNNGQLELGLTSKSNVGDLNGGTWMQT